MVGGASVAAAAAVLVRGEEGAAAVDLSRALDLASLDAAKRSSLAPSRSLEKDGEHASDGDAAAAAAAAAAAVKAPAAAAVKAAVPKAQRTVRMNVPDDAPVLHSRKEPLARLAQVCK